MVFSLFLSFFAKKSIYFYEVIKMNYHVPLYPVSRNVFVPHYESDEIFTPTPLNGYTPAQLRTAYGFDSSFSAEGVKIAVVCAFDNVALSYNTEMFCRNFNLPLPDISVHYPFGKADITTESWITESSLDVQWISVFAPKAQIMCVFAKNALTDNMLSAVEYAKTLKPDIISMSFGTVESADFLQTNRIFDTSGIIFVSSSGNTPAIPHFPSSSPHVLSVGATELILNGNHTRLSESVWKNTGSGTSGLFPIPPYQLHMNGINTLTEGQRGVPDVSFCGSRSYGASIFVSSRGGWTTAGGTSLSCACVSGICACIVKSNPSIKETGINNFLYALAGKTRYTLPQYYFYDITSGSNGRYSASEGWDLCSGLGSITSKAVKHIF